MCSDVVITVKWFGYRLVEPLCIDFVSCLKRCSFLPSRYNIRSATQRLSQLITLAKETNNVEASFQHQPLNMPVELSEQLQVLPLLPKMNSMNCFHILLTLNKFLLLRVASSTRSNVCNQKKDLLCGRQVVILSDLIFVVKISTPSELSRQPLPQRTDPKHFSGKFGKQHSVFPTV